MLVAGQALATWADFYGVLPEGALEAGVTRDFDFLGDKSQAGSHAEGLKVLFQERVEFYVPSPGDQTPNSAIIIINDLNGRSEPIVIDYLRALQGYTARDEDRLRSIAVKAQIHGRDLLVMHPFDCLKSRIHNIATLPSKRNEMGFAQARLAIKVLNRHLADVCDNGDERRVGLPLAERVLELAHSADGKWVWATQGIDLLDAVPSASFCQPFQELRWPQALAYVTRRREAYAKALRGGN